MNLGPQGVGKRGREPFLLPLTRLFSGSAAQAKGEFQPQLLRHPPRREPSLRHLI